MKPSENATRLAKVLVSSLREKNVEMSLGEGLKIIARLTGHSNWNKLLAKLKSSDRPLAILNSAANRVARREQNTDFKALFPEAELPPSFLVADSETRHPFPPELKVVPELAQWRECWEKNALSTHDRHFFPPMLPPASFISPQLTYELRRDWKIGSDGKAHRTRAYHFENGSCGVLARNEHREIVGAASWNWWGTFGRMNGLCYRIYLLTESGWLYVTFELRPNHPFPSPGLVVIRDDTGKHRRQIESSLRKLSHLKAFRYAG